MKKYYSMFEEKKTPKVGSSLAIISLPLLFKIE
jgi:hypothetical protein